MIKIAIIGGGPAGVMAAIVAAQNSSNSLTIDIFEKKEALKTILYTGNGRCNLTNELYNYKELASNYPRGEKFLYSVFSKFGVRQTMDFFTSLGVKLYTQEDNRVFPESDDAGTVRNALLDKAKKLGINIKNHTQVLKIEKKNGKFLVYTGNSQAEYDKLIISTGGDYRNPTGSGYEFSKSLGHKITVLKPALSALRIKETYTASLAGVSIKDAEITVFYQENQAAKAKGDFVFTHKGISGPLAFKISSYCAFLDYNENSPLIMKVNFVPDKTKEELDRELTQNLKEDSRKSIDNILKKYAPKSIITALLGSEFINPEKKASQITKEDRKTIIKLLTQTILSAKSPEPEGEIVTAGGIELDEVDSKIMESKLVSGLYFCGEVLNIDGLTGGFNLQACWSTGYIAGINAAKF